MGIFDTHAHYLREDFGEGLDSLLSGMPEMGVEKIMAVGYDLASSEEEAGACPEVSVHYRGGRHTPGELRRTPGGLALPDRGAAEAPGGDGAWRDRA